MVRSAVVCPPLALAWPDNSVNLLSRLSRVDDQCFETCALSYPEFPTAPWSGCPIGCDGCVRTDGMRYDTPVSLTFNVS